MYLEEEPKVAAIGAGMDIFQPSGNMVVDIGGGTTDVAVLSMGDIVTASSIKVAGDRFDQDILTYGQQDSTNPNQDGEVEVNDPNLAYDEEAVEAAVAKEKLFVWLTI